MRRASLETTSADISFSANASVSSMNSSDSSANSLDKKHSKLSLSEGFRRIVINDGGPFFSLLGFPLIFFVGMITLFLGGSGGGNGGGGVTEFMCTVVSMSCSVEDEHGDGDDSDEHDSCSGDDDCCDNGCSGGKSSNGNAF